MAKNINVVLQEMANKSALDVQKLVNSANKQTLDFNKTEAATARDFNSKEAQKARDFEKMMSDTSHQREVVDLKKAGLNPVLSANSGANSYTSASANANNASASLDSGAGAMSGLFGNLMSSITGLQQSQMSANAQLKAAKLSSDATKFAAMQSAQAQKYASDMAYKTQMDKPQSNVAGILDKYFGKYIPTKESTNQFFKKVQSRIDNLDKDTKSSLKQGYFTLHTLDYCNNILKKNFGINLNKTPETKQGRADRRSIAYALWQLQYSKTAEFGLQTLAQMKKKYPK